jgi:hypothetical protein
LSGVVGLVVALLVIGVGACVVWTRRSARDDTREPGIYRPVLDDGYRVLATLRHPQPRGMVKRCIVADRQTRVIELATLNWQRQARLDGRHLRGDARAKKTRAGFELGKLWPDPPRAGVPTLDELADLTRKLEESNRRLRGLERRFAPAGTMQLTTPVAAAAAFVNWLVGSTARRLFEIFKRVIRAPLALVVWLWRSLASAFNGWFAAAQALSLLLTLSVPVVAYILIGYTDQWGSTTDIVTAFATGFAGKVAIDFGTSLRPGRDPGTSETKVTEHKPPATTSNGGGDPLAAAPAGGA